MFTEARRAIGRWRRIRNRHPDPTWHGTDFIDDVIRRMGHHPINVIFDAGAWYGITALEFSDSFPKADVYAFEPTRMNFDRMKANLTGAPQIRQFNFGFGEMPGKALIRIDAEHPSTCNVVDTPDANTETIAIESIDHFCEIRRIGVIDILKLDVEGQELQALRGARSMLAAESITLIKAECAVDPDTVWHTSFIDLCAFLLPLNYRLFGIYEQRECWHRKLPTLRMFDAVWVSKRAALKRHAA
jgi:FkbM family methyltransferase